jgi:hypothetical protein
MITGAKCMRICGWASSVVAEVPGLYSLSPRRNHSSQALHANSVQDADIICDVCENHKAFFGSEMFHEVQILSREEVQGKSLRYGKWSARR